MFGRLEREIQEMKLEMVGSSGCFSVLLWEDIRKEMNLFSLFLFSGEFGRMPTSNYTTTILCKTYDFNTPPLDGVSSGGVGVFSTERTASQAQDASKGATRASRRLPYRG